MEGKVGEISEDMKELKEKMRKVESGNTALENRINELETIAETELVRKKCPVKGKNFLASEEISCHRKKFHGIKRNFLSQKETSCHRNEFHATVKNFLSQEEIPKLPLLWKSSVVSDWLKVLAPTK